MYGMANIGGGTADRLVKIDKPTVRALYDFEEASSPGLADRIRERFSKSTV